MQLYLIRHAESENNAKPPYQRVEDPHLTAIGRLQAKHLGEWFQTLPIDTLITSPVRRALQTTRSINAAKGQHTQVWADCFEEGGIYPGYGPAATKGGPGLSRADVLSNVGEATSLQLDESIGDDGWYGRDRETADEAVVRAAAVVERLIDTFANTGQSVAAIIHADFKRKLLAQMLNGRISTDALGPLLNTGITKVGFDGKQWQLEWFNSVSHLPSRLITSVET